MGLFGDKKLKALENSLSSGVLSIQLSGSMGNTRETVARVVIKLQSDARALASDGRKAEAESKLRAARRTDSSELSTLWNGVLDHVLSEL